MEPATHYAASGDVSVAYQVFGDGSHDLLLAPGFISHLDLAWEEPSVRRFLERLASFSRVILFDKRGTGLSNPTPGVPTLEEHVMDVQAVLDAAGAESVTLADVVGSTERAAEMGDQRWADLLQTFQETVRRQLGRYGGRLVSFAGDGFLATFSGPAAAIRGASAVREAVRSLGLRLRTGVHTGEVEVLGSELGGIGVHLAARVMAQAEPDEILVSSTVRDLVVGSRIGFEPRGTHHLKGIPGEWQLLSVVQAA